MWQDMENISADMDLVKARRIAERDYGLLPEKIEKVHGYDDLNFYLTPPVRKFSLNFKNFNRLCLSG